MMKHLLSEIIFLPTLGALIILFFPVKEKQLQKYVAIATAFLTFVLSCVMIVKFDRFSGGMQFVENYSWISTFKISYLIGVDGLSVALIPLTALIFLLCSISSLDQSSGVKGYFSLFLVLETTVLGIFSAQDLFLFFTFWAASLLPAYFMISVWGNKNREYAATKFFIYQLAGGAFLLLGMFAVYNVIEPHSFSLFDLSGGKFAGIPITFGERTFKFEHLVFVLMLVGFAVRLPVVPFHSWFPLVQTEAPPALSVVLAAAFIKTGAYALVRVNYALFPEAVTWIAPVLAAAGVINILYGGICALGQKDLRRLVAFSCVSHMGFVLLGLAILSTTAFHGAILQMLSHGVYAGLLFFLVGILGNRSGHFRIVNDDGTPGFGGLVARAPLLTGFFTVAVFSALGVPGLGAFASEILVFLGSFPHHRSLTIMGLVGVVLTAGYFLWMFRRVFLGKVNRGLDAVTDLTLREKLFLSPLVLLCFVAGSYPTLFIDIAKPTVNQVLAALGGNGVQ